MGTSWSSLTPAATSDIVIVVIVVDVVVMDWTSAIAISIGVASSPLIVIFVGVAHLSLIVIGAATRLASTSSIGVTPGRCAIWASVTPALTGTVYDSYSNIIVQNALNMLMVYFSN